MAKKSPSDQQEKWDDERFSEYQRRCTALAEKLRELETDYRQKKTALKIARRNLRVETSLLNQSIRSRGKELPLESPREFAESVLALQSKVEGWEDAVFKAKHEEELAKSKLEGGKAEYDLAISTYLSPLRGGKGTTPTSASTAEVKEELPDGQEVNGKTSKPRKKGRKQ